MRRRTYVKVNGKDYSLVISKKARNNAAYNFIDNLCFVLEALDFIELDKVYSVRNSAFDYDCLILLASDTEDAVILDFNDINERRKIDIDFSTDLLFAV